MKLFLALAPVALMAACAPPSDVPNSGGGQVESAAHHPVARLGERVYVDGPEVTVSEVLEDSRCPKNVQCVWAGRVQIRANIHLGAGDLVRELELGQPVHVADGMLQLVEVRPARTDAAIAPGEYRFVLRFDGGY